MSASRTGLRARDQPGKEGSGPRRATRVSRAVGCGPRQGRRLLVLSYGGQEQLQNLQGKFAGLRVK